MNLSPNMTSEHLHATLAALPDELGCDEIGALFETILDTYEIGNFDGLKIGTLLAKQRSDDSIERDYDAGEVSDDQRARAALHLLPRRASGLNIVNVICMVMEIYDLNEKQAEICLRGALQKYQGGLSARQRVMEMLAKIGIDMDMIENGQIGLAEEGTVAAQDGEAAAKAVGAPVVRIDPDNLEDVAEQLRQLVRLTTEEPKGSA